MRHDGRITAVEKKECILRVIGSRIGGREACAEIDAKDSGWQVNTAVRHEWLAMDEWPLRASCRSASGSIRGRRTYGAASQHAKRRRHDDAANDIQRGRRQRRAHVIEDEEVAAITHSEDVTSSCSSCGRLSVLNRCRCDDGIIEIDGCTPKELCPSSDLGHEDGAQAR